MTAAFGRLCVETQKKNSGLLQHIQPPSGGCVLKRHVARPVGRNLAAAFGRLCVETHNRSSDWAICLSAAFGRLCVETVNSSNPVRLPVSRLRAAVC